VTSEKVLVLHYLWFKKERHGFCWKNVGAQVCGEVTLSYAKVAQNVRARKKSSTLPHGSWAVERNVVGIDENGQVMW